MLRSQQQDMFVIERRIKCKIVEPINKAGTMLISKMNLDTHCLSPDSG